MNKTEYTKILQYFLRVSNQYGSRGFTEETEEYKMFENDTIQEILKKDNGA